MSEWRIVKLGELCKNVTSGGTPTSTVASYYNPPTIPWVKTKEINYCRIYESENYISEEGLCNSSAKIIPANSVIVAMYGQGDTAGRVAINKVPITTNQACCNLTLDESLADYEFVYYNLCTLYSKLVSLKKGAAQPNLNAKIIKGLEIDIPDLQTQHRIATTLSRYDSLIDNYQKQIKLLEEAAQRLYKEWFVNLRFPGHENTKIVDGVPEGWEKKKLISLVDVQYGYAFDGHLLNDKGEGMPILRIRNIPDGYTKDYTAEQASSDYIVHKGDIVVGMDGIFHINTWSGDDAYLVQRACSFRPHNEKLKGFIFQAIVEPIKFFEKTLVGATVAHLGKKHIDSIELLVPSKERLFAPLQKMYKQRMTLLSQLRLLTESRERMLQKLLSGEIEV